MPFLFHSSSSVFSSSMIWKISPTERLSRALVQLSLQQMRPFMTVRRQRWRKKDWKLSTRWSSSSSEGRSTSKSSTC